MRLSTLFSFAWRRGYISENFCDRIERITIDRPPPRILTVPQVERLIQTCPDQVKPYLVLSVFVGLRPEGIAPRKMKGMPRRILDWEFINLDTGTVDITEKRKRRLVPLEPRAVQLLTPIARPRGPVVPSHSAVRAWQSQVKKQFEWPKFHQDILRHTCASFLLALIGDVGKVATRVGNSPKILLEHYVSPVSPADCAKFWSCAPVKELDNGAKQLQLGL